MKLEKLQKELERYSNALVIEMIIIAVFFVIIFLEGIFGVSNAFFSLLFLMVVNFFPMLLFVVLPVTVSAYFTTKNNIRRENEKLTHLKEMESSVSEDEIVKDILKDDENFSLELFYKDVENKFKKVYLKEDSDYVRSFISKKVMDKIENLENEQDISVVMINIYDMDVVDDYRYLNVRIKLDIETNSSKNRRIYNFKFKRKLGVKSHNNEITNCPNCGAVLKVDFNGVCDYCKKTILSGDYDWVIEDIKDIPVTDNYLKDLTDKDGTYLRDTVTYEEYLEMDKDNDGSINFLERFPKTEEEVIKDILEVDKSFDINYFKEYVKLVYGKLIDTYVKGDFKVLRPFVNDKFYQVFKSSNDIQSSDVKAEYNFKGILVKEFKVDGDRQIITVAFTVESKIGLNYKIKYYDLQKDTKERTMRYLMTFSRDKKLKSENKPLDKFMLNCPNCGNHIDLNELGECSYCNTNVTNGNYGWTVVDMKNINVRNK